jgi:stage IV sporulation protein FB
MSRFKLSWFFVGFFVLLFLLGFPGEGAGLLAALGIHELGHIIVAAILGYSTKQLRILPLGGQLDFADMIELCPSAEARIALAGPAANFLTAVLALALWGSDSSGLHGYFIRASLMLMAYNLLPALPLDGGRALRAKLMDWFSFYRATAILVGITWLSALSLMSLGILYLFNGVFKPTIFAGSAFLLYNAIRERRQVMIPLVRYVLSRKEKLTGLRLVQAQTLVAAPDARVGEVLKLIRPQQYYQISVLDKFGAVAGLITEHQLLDYYLAGKGTTPLAEFLKPRN